MYHYALILYHLTTARGLGSGARSVSGNAKVNSRRFGSPPAEICGDLREHCCGSQRLETPLVARRSGRGGAVVVASPPAARRWPVGGLDRRTETVTRAGCGVRWYWWRLARHADLGSTGEARCPLDACTVAVRRRPTEGCAWWVLSCVSGCAMRGAWSGRACGAWCRGRPSLTGRSTRTRAPSSRRSCVARTQTM